MSYRGFRNPGDYLLTRTADPGDTPISLDEAKAHLRIQQDAEDSLIASLIQAVTDYFDVPNGVIGKALYTQTWALSVPNVDERFRIVLPITPVQSVSTITYYDGSNVQQSLTVGDFHLYGNEDWAYLYPKDGISWPGVFSREDAITVTFVAGFGAAAAVPQGIKQAMLLLLSHWYENRSSSIVGTSAQEMPTSVQSLVNLYRKGWVA